MLDLDSMLCPFCGGEMDERGGQCNYKKKTMTIDLNGALKKNEQD